jgi:opacity protein-like surface antigen
MRTLNTLSCAAIVALGWASSALGADMLFPPAMRDVRRLDVVEVGTGWYLRGDAGYVDYIALKDRRDAILDQSFDTARLKQTWSAGGGFGYKFLNFFRADVTADYRFESEFRGTSSRTGYVSDSRRDWGELETTTGLVNAYLDLGNWYGVTPYVGVGVGAAMNRLLEHRAQVTCITVTATCGTIGDQPAVGLRDRSKIDLAWALMGGIAVDVGGGFKVDAGYRYVNLGEIKTHATGAGAPTRTDDIEAHEVRVGLRYMIDQP